METTILEQDGKIVAKLKGRLDTAAAPGAEIAMSPLCDSGSKDVIIDCTDLVYISSSGLRIFLSILKNAKAKGNHVYVKGISGDIRSVFAMTGFINLFEFL